MWVLEFRKHGITLIAFMVLERVTLYLVYTQQYPSCKYLKRMGGCQFRCSWKWSKTRHRQLGSCVDITSRDLPNPSYQLKDHKHSGRQKSQHTPVGILICKNNAFRQSEVRPSRSQKQNPAVCRYIALFLLSILPEIRYRWQAICNSAFVFFSHLKRFIAKYRRRVNKCLFPLRPTPGNCDRTICMLS